MTVSAVHIAAVALTGVGATLAIDLWNLALKYIADIPSLSYCLLGRWVAHMPAGTFRHRSIRAAESKRFECALGWMAHYAIGVGLAGVFALVLVPGWLSSPSLVPAVVYGIVTVAMPFLVMQPALGLGIASAATSRPMHARLKSLATHAIYGIGLYASGLGAAALLAR